jgi:hypothetical protein
VNAVALNRALRGWRAAKVVRMSEYQQDPSANTGRFRAFVERGADEDVARPRSFPASRGMLVAIVVVIAVIIVLAVVL